MMRAVVRFALVAGNAGFAFFAAWALYSVFSGVPLETFDRFVLALAVVDSACRCVFTAWWILK